MGRAGRYPLPHSKVHSMRKIDEVDMRLYGVFCPICDICFFPSDVVKIDLPGWNETYRYEDLDLGKHGTSDSPVVDAPVYHVECLE